MPRDRAFDAPDLTASGSSVSDSGRTPDPSVDEEFGITMDPCEHPSINGTTCAACGQEVPDGS